MRAEPALREPAKQGSVLAFDYGAKRVGVAVGDLSLRIAHAVDAITTGDEAQRWRQIDQLIDEWAPVLFVVGLPTHADGTQHKLAPAIRGFGNKLKQRCRLDVQYVDERLSSYAASRKLSAAGISARQQKGMLDSAAAREILQSFFDEAASTR